MCNLNISYIYIYIDIVESISYNLILHNNINNLEIIIKIIIQYSNELGLNPAEVAYFRVWL